MRVINHISNEEKINYYQKVTRFLGFAYQYPLFLSHKNRIQISANETEVHRVVFVGLSGLKKKIITLRFMHKRNP